MAAKKPIHFDEIRKIEFEILSKTAKICDENKLRYYLGYGTLLGAVRHQGFIPWDDDIDILMPRPDYLRLIEIIDQGSFANMQMFSLQNEKDYLYPFAKLVDNRTLLYQEYNETLEVELGVNIDIFPLDGLPDNYYMSFLLLKALIFLKFVWTMCNQKFPPFATTWYKKLGKISLALLFKPINYKQVLRIIDRLSAKYDFDSSNYIGCLVFGVGPNERIRRKSIEGAEKLAFEGEQFFVPSDYDTYLSNVYGDYMQLPPENQRISTHRWQAYWK